MSTTDWAPVAEASRSHLADVARDGAKRTLVALKITDEGITEQTFEEAATWAEARAAELVGKSWDEDGNLVDNPDADMAITDTIREEIRVRVSEALADGSSAADLADEIEGMPGFSGDRAELVARTEIIRANGQGQLAAMRASGVVEQKGWSTSNEEQVCEDCQANEDEGGIGLDEDFPSGDDAPPAHPACMCALVAVMAEEEGDSEEESADEEDEKDDEAAE